MEQSHLSEHAAQISAGLSRQGWDRFLSATKLPVYQLPGGGRVVDRTEFFKAIADEISEQRKAARK